MQQDTLVEAMAVLGNKNHTTEPKEHFYIPVYKWVLREKDLTGNEKILLSLITSLDQSDHCYATNQYFADILNVSTRMIRKMLNHLVELGMITYEGRYKNRRILISNCDKRGIKKAAL